MRARWIEAWGGPLLAGERPDPSPGPGEVLVEVEACGVGLTVLNCMRGDLGNRTEDLPRVPGHELVGTVTEAGDAAHQDLLGRRVMAYFYLSCGACARCVAGDESLCLKLGGHVGVQRDGGYAALAVLPAFNAIPLPPGIGATAATAIPDAIATPVHVAARASIGEGERVAVIAAGGGVGVHMVQVARLRGAAVAGLDVAPAKLGHLEDELAVAAVDSSDFGAVRLPAGWDGAVDVVVDLLGTEASLAWGLRALGPGGRLVVLTTFPGRSFAVAPRALVFGEHSVLASRYARRSELAEAAQLVADGRVTPVVSRVAGPGGVDALHDQLRAGSLLGRGALAWTA
jgi:propanol-preferring alcohol dehydrogenase